MEFTELKELLTQFEDSSIREFDLKTGDFNLYLSKNDQRSQSLPSVEAPLQTLNHQEVSPSQVTAEEVLQPTSAVVEGTTIDSPLVGIVYLKSGPDEPDFKKVGDTVAVGDTLCIVEAMKIMNEINSDQAGTITEILIENEDVVEYGQSLFRIV